MRSECSETVSVVNNWSVARSRACSRSEEQLLLYGSACFVTSRCQHQDLCYMQFCDSIFTLCLQTTDLSKEQTSNSVELRKLAREFLDMLRETHGSEAMSDHHHVSYFLDCWHYDPDKQYMQFLGHFSGLWSCRVTLTSRHPPVTFCRSWGVNAAQNASSSSLLHCCRSRVIGHEAGHQPTTGRTHHTHTHALTVNWLLSNKNKEKWLN